MALGVINTSADFDNLTLEQQEVLINTWVDEERDGL